MRFYISPNGLRPALESDKELIDFFLYDLNPGRIIRTKRNVELFYKVINNERVYLRDPKYSIIELKLADFILNTTDIYIQSFGDFSNNDTRLILSQVDHISSVGLGLYVHTIATPVVEAMHRTMLIDDFLNEPI